MFARVFCTAVCRLWDALEWVGSRIVRTVARVLNFRLWCDHSWFTLGAEEIGEEFRYRIHAQCSHCGITRFFPEN